MGFAVVDLGGVLLIGGVVARAHGVLQLVDGRRVEQVELTAVAVLVAPADLQRVAVGRAGRVGRGVALRRLVGQHVQVSPLDARRRAAEIALDHRPAQPQRLEDLRPVVALHGADAHLGDGLDYALGRSFQVLAHGDFVVGGHQPAGDQVVERLEGQVWIDRVGPVADEAGVVVDFARLARLDDEADQRARAGGNEVLVQPGDGQQRRDGHGRAAHAAVGQDEQVGPPGHGGVGRDT